ncbi:MAG: hypothetical protein GX042_03160 [Bacteroidales bacterium]|nr:hypothetical protein [Bacteroidales bacterium]
MRKTFFILSLIFYSLLIVQCNTGKRELHQKLTQMAVELNESAPVSLDQYTRFEEATVTNDNVFRYRYSVTNINNPDSLLESRKDELMKNIRTMFSTNADLRIFTENNVVIEYDYTDEQNNHIRTIRINPEDYQ